MIYDLLVTRSCLIIMDDFFQLFNWFQLFSSENELPKVVGQSEQLKNEPDSVDGISYFSLIFSYSILHWFSVILFFIDFQLFYFPLIFSYSIFHWFSVILLFIDFQLFYISLISSYSIFHWFSVILFFIDFQLFYFPLIFSYSIFHWFSVILLFIDFQLFYFLTRIIPL
jgi:hypothetical protein